MLAHILVRQHGMLHFGMAMTLKITLNGYLTREFEDRNLLVLMMNKAKLDN